MVKTFKYWALTLVFVAPVIKGHAQTLYASGLMNYEGRLADSSGNPLSGPVDITLDIVTQDGTCALYSETHVAVSLKEGFFSLRIGNGSVNYNPLTIDKVFKNGITHSNATVANATYCNVGGNVTVGNSDNRILRVTINDGSSTETLADQVIAAVPSAVRSDYATNAASLNGIADSGFIKVDTNVTQSRMTTLTNGADAVGLHHHDSQYAKINSSSSMTFGAGQTLGLGSFSNAQQTTMIAGLSAADAGKTWYNSSTNKIMYWDGSMAEAVGTGSGVVTSINGDTSQTHSLAVGTSGMSPAWSTATGTHTLNLPMASTASVTAGLISNSDYSTFTNKLSSSSNPNASGDIAGNFGAGLTIKGDAVTSSMILDGQVDSADLASSAVTTAKIADSNVTTAKIANSAVTLSKIDGTGATALQSLRRNSGNTAWEFFTAVDNDTTYSADGNGLELSSTTFGLELDGTTLAKSSTGLKVNAIGSAEVTDGSLTNADISSSAAIGRSKISSGTANMVLVNNGSGVMSESATIDATELGQLNGVTSNIQTQLDSKQASIGYTPANKAGDTITGNLSLSSQNDLRLEDADSSNYAAIQAPTTISANYTLTLPSDDGNSGELLQTDGSGNLSWVAPSTGNLKSDGSVAMTGSFNFNSNKGINLAAPTAASDAVNKSYADGNILGMSLSTPTGHAGQSIRWNAGNTAWEYYTPATGDVSSSINLAAGAGLTGGGDLTANRTFNVGAGVGIVVNADDIAVDVGTTAGKIVQLDGTGKLPAIDGSQLTNLPTSSVTANSLDFAELKNAMTLDASTDISVSGANVLSVTNSGTGNSFVVNDQASDTTPFVVDASGNVGMGAASPGFQLHVGGSAGSSAQIAQFNGTVEIRNNSTGDPTTLVLNNLNGGNTGTSIELKGNTSGVPRNAAKISGSQINGNGRLGFSTSQTNTLTERMSIESDGKVGIGTSTPRAGLDVASAIVSASATSNATSTIDFSSGNLQYTTNNCGAFALHNLKDGGTYMFAVQGTTVSTCSFTAFSGAGTGSLTVHMPPDHGATFNGKHTVYNLAVMGTHVYIAWNPNY